MHAVDHVPLDLVGIALIAENDEGILDELAALLQRPAWMADAACREHPELNWHPARGDDLRPLRAVCADCLVRDECLAFALEHEHGGNVRVGVWGGTSAKQRRAVPTVELERVCADCDEPFATSDADRTLCKGCHRRAYRRPWARERRARQRAERTVSVA